MSLSFTHTLQVPASAIDLHGHINNVEYIRWMQDAATFTPKPIPEDIQQLYQPAP